MRSECGPGREILNLNWRVKSKESLPQIMAAITPVHLDEMKTAPDISHIDNAHIVEEIDRALEKGQPVLMKSVLDKVGVWQAVKTYKRVSLICMAAAFSASLDGYRELFQYDYSCFFFAYSYICSAWL